MKRPNCRQALHDDFQQHSALSTIVKTTRLLDVLGGRNTVARAQSVHRLLLSLLLRFQQIFFCVGQVRVLLRLQQPSLLDVSVPVPPSLQV